MVYYANLPQGEGARVLDQQQVGLELSGDTAGLTATELTVVGENGRRLVWYAYVVGGYAAATATAAKWYQIVAALQSRWDAQVWLLSSPCEATDCGSARRTLADFARVASPTGLSSSIAQQAPTP